MKGLIRFLGTGRALAAQTDVAHPNEVTIEECDEGVGLGGRDERHVVAQACRERCSVSLEVARALRQVALRRPEARPGSRESGPATRRPPQSGGRSRWPRAAAFRPAAWSPFTTARSTLTNRASLRMASSSTTDGRAGHRSSGAPSITARFLQYCPRPAAIRQAQSPRHRGQRGSSAEGARMLSASRSSSSSQGEPGRDVRMCDIALG